MNRIFSVMELETVIQDSESSLFSNECDLFVAALGFEVRATYLTEQYFSRLPNSKATKIAFSFPDRRRERSIQNRETFENLGFNIVECSGDDSEPLKAVLKNWADASNSGFARIIIDYSSMTKAWYAGLLNWFREYEGRIQKLEVRFSYSPSKYAAPKKPTPNKMAAPIEGFADLSMPEKGTALILGLGYHQERGIGLREFVEPQETFAFYTDPAASKRFVNAVARNNRELIESLGSEKVFQYPYNDLVTTSHMLTSLVTGLSKDFRVVLAPLGPKPFSLICMFLAMRFQNLDVWRVSSGEGGNIYEREPTGEVICCATTFVS